MKLFMEPVEVAVRGEGPSCVRWRRKSYPVLQVAERWCWRGRWWTDAELNGEQRRYYRLICQQAQLEVFERQGSWTLSRLLD
ncbi:MAG: hypothetical protein ACYCW6_15265 [Candidatus Xenobia bacterium]